MRKRHVDDNDIHAAALAVHWALVDEMRRRGGHVAGGTVWDAGLRDGHVDVGTTFLAEALLRAGWSRPPPPVSSPRDQPEQVTAGGWPP